MTGMQGGRRRPPKKISRVRKPETPAASLSLDESSSSQERSYGGGKLADYLSIDKRLPNDIKGPGGRMARIEYDNCHPVNLTAGNIPVGPPDFATVERKGLGRFYYYKPGDPDKTCWLVAWYSIPGYYPNPGVTAKPSKPLRPVKHGSSPPCIVDCRPNADPFATIHARDERARYI